MKKFVATILIAAGIAACNGNSTSDANIVDTVPSSTPGISDTVSDKPDSSAVQRDKSASHTDTSAPKK